MFRNLFKPDSPLMIVMTQITDCIFLSLFWVLGCVPVVTIGTSFAAMYDAVYRTFRKGEKNSWQCFLACYRSNWKSGIVPTILVLGAFILSVRGLIALWNAAVWGQISWMLFAAGGFVGIVILGILSIAFPMLSRFENSVAALIKNTLLLGISQLPRTVALGLVNAVTIFLCVRFVIPLFFLPALAALIGTVFIEPMFRPYMAGE